MTGFHLYFSSKKSMRMIVKNTNLKGRCDISQEKRKKEYRN